MHRPWIMAALAMALALACAACAPTKPDTSHLIMTPAERALWRDLALPLCAAEQLRECR